MEKLGKWKQLFQHAAVFPFLWPIPFLASLSRFITLFAAVGCVQCHFTSKCVRLALVQMAICRFHRRGNATLIKVPKPCGWQEAICSRWLRQVPLCLKCVGLALGKGTLPYGVKCNGTLNCVAWRLAKTHCRTSRRGNAILFKVFNIFTSIGILRNKSAVKKSFLV